MELVSTNAAIITTAMMFVWGAVSREVCRQSEEDYEAIQSLMQNLTPEEKEKRKAYDEWTIFKMMASLLNVTTKDTPSIKQRMLDMMTNPKMRLYMSTKTTRHKYTTKFKPFLNLKYGDDKELINSFTLSAYEYISLQQLMLNYASKEELRSENDSTKRYFQAYNDDGSGLSDLGTIHCTLKLILKLKGVNISAEIERRINHFRFASTKEGFNRHVRNWLLIRDIQEQFALYEKIFKQLGNEDNDDFKDLEADGHEELMTPEIMTAEEKLNAEEDEWMTPCQRNYLKNIRNQYKSNNRFLEHGSESLTLNNNGPILQPSFLADLNFDPWNKPCSDSNEILTSDQIDGEIAIINDINKVANTNNDIGPGIRMANHDTDQLDDEV